MTLPFKRKDIEQTKSLAEAVYRLFGWDLAPRGIHYLFDLEFEERVCIFKGEAMSGKIARAYDELGRTVRKDTYRKIAEDFKARVHYIDDGTKNILDVGCGCGLLSLELADYFSGDIIGLDLSKDMIFLAKGNLERRVKGVTAALKRRVSFVQGSVYDLDKSAIESVDYVVCRNALHRFKHPELAIKRMYDALRQDGMMYLRDLRRDAEWTTIISRIGEERWKRPALVKDYIGAMAQMLTLKEIKGLLADLGITSFEITDGSYKSNQKMFSSPAINEYAPQVEYACVIKKS